MNEQEPNKSDGRMLRGSEIVNKNGQVKQIEAQTYRVRSQSGNGFYVVTNGEAWDCTCPDHTYRKVKCKHIWAVEISLALKKEVQISQVIKPIDTLVCQYCGSENIVKNAKRHNKYGDIQRYSCRECGKRFSINLGFERMKASPQVITSAMQLYFTGESLRNVQKFLLLQGIRVTHVAVYKWIKKYVDLMELYLERVKPKVSDTWRADEIWVKINGNMKYVFALMDDETRFWIAQEVADTKFKHDARNLFRMGKELMGKKPMTIITDGLPAYHDAYKKEYWTNTKPRTEHIAHIRIKGDKNNNKMERLNGEIRDREKVIRGLKKEDTPILKGYQIFHNYIRPHEGLNGRTPAELCNIEIKGDNKWFTLIQNAKKEIGS